MAEGALPSAPVWSDIRTFDGRPWRGKVAGIVAGYPCQPFSTAGRGAGFDDPRNLWPDIARVIAEIRPWWCFFENVSGHLRRGYFTDVRPDLETLGFRCAEQVVKASDVGAPHRRERLFVLAVANPDGEPRAPSRGRHPEDERKEGGEGSNNQPDRPSELVANSDGMGRIEDDDGGGSQSASRGQQVQERTPDTGTVHAGSRMADSDGSGRGTPVGEHTREPVASIGCSELADAQLDGGSEGGQQQRSGGQDALGRSRGPMAGGSGALADAGSSGPERTRLLKHDPASAGRSERLADPERADRRSEVEGRSKAGGATVGRGQPGVRRTEFPPSRNDWRAWETVARDGAPLPVEPAVRRVADGPSAGLGLPRSEQLRLLGNAVVPAQAALAWQILWAVANGDLE